MNSSQGRLADKIVVFTGAGGGIGLSAVRRFVAEGARVVAVDISDRVVEATADLGDAVISVVSDVATWEGNREAVSAAVQQWGRLDCFVGNAGITDGARPLEDIAGEDLAGAFRELFDVNVLALLLGSRAALPELVESRGSIVLTGSFASSNAGGGGALYTASKHAVLGLVRQLAYELAPDVRVNGIAPGVAPTRLKGVSALGQTASDSVLDGTAAILPLQRVPNVADFDGAFTLLASDEAAIMTGSMLTIDSGLSIRGLSRPGGRVQTP
ncbi:SDR family oxidoreductase [Janibacter sp. LM]|uniref:SDR family oxidoreductase n=1 Tax=Janibacter sp. LM TaxID=3144845 RepID=UPI0031F6FFC3